MKIKFRKKKELEIVHECYFCGHSVMKGVFAREKYFCENCMKEKGITVYYNDKEAKQE